MRRRDAGEANPLEQLFPASGRVLLTGGGKQFIERIGVTAVRDAVYRLMLGENLRTLTEPLTRRRLAQISGSLVAMFAQGYLTIDGFQQRLSALATSQFRNARRNDRASSWPAQWIIGLTGKGNQNVLRSDPQKLNQYVADFDRAIRDAAKHCADQLGDYHMSLGHYVGADGKQAELDWQGIAYLTTAIGAQTLTVRGSDKSMYGKLFEKLVLGSVLTLLGFQRVDPRRNTRDRGVFWLSDRSENRERDATLLIEPGKLAKFDIGFIGPGNPEIAKDKLSRYGASIDVGEGVPTSVTFVIVDRLPQTDTTETAAARIGAEIIERVMQYWPRRLARLLRDRLGFQHPIADMPDSELPGHLKEKMEQIAVQDFLSGVSITDLEPAPPPEAEERPDDSWLNEAGFVSSYKPQPNAVVGSGNTKKTTRPCAT